MKIDNRIAKYFGPEDHLHIQVCYYLRTQYPKAIFHHSPNEGKRGYVQKIKIKEMGVKAGFPDLIVIFEGRNLGLELKTEKGIETKFQTEWIKVLSGNGWMAAVAWGFDEAKQIIDQFIKNK